MPTQTFFNLPEEKREKLLLAATKEFTRVSLHDASINKIIQEAGISRGSFYMYFDNKEDLYLYLLQEHKDLVYNHMRIYLDENKGDIIETFIDLFDFIVKMGIIKENLQFFKNIFTNLTYNTSRYLLPKEKSNMKLGLKELLNAVDKSKLNIENDEELLDMVGLLTTILFKSIVKAYMTNCPMEKVRSKFIRELTILQKGLYR